MAIGSDFLTIPTPKSFTLELYTDQGGVLGSLLGSYAGVTSDTLLTYASVAAGGTTLTQGATYWLVASSSEELIWNWVGQGASQRGFYTEPGRVYGPLTSGAFSVNVADAPTVPGPLAVLPFALMALKRHRRA